MFDFFGLGQAVLAPVAAHADMDQNNQDQQNQGGQQDQQLNLQGWEEWPQPAQLDLNQPPVQMGPDLNAQPAMDDPFEMIINPGEGEGQEAILQIAPPAPLEQNQEQMQLPVLMLEPEEAHFHMLAHFPQMIAQEEELMDEELNNMVVDENEHLQMEVEEANNMMVDEIEHVQGNFNQQPAVNENEHVHGNVNQHPPNGVQI
jgi:hypothetical protein